MNSSLPAPQPVQLTEAERVNVLLGLSIYQAEHPTDPANPRSQWEAEAIESAIAKLDRAAAE